MKKESIPKKFWKQYEQADLLKREEILKPIVKNLNSLYRMKEEKMRKHALMISIRGYFDDLLDYKEGIS